MKSKSKFKLSNLVYLVIIALILIPQTRQSILIVLHKGLSYINQSTLIDQEQRVLVDGELWKLKGNDGSVINYNSLKEKVVFINFWATWCPPCIAEMPNLQDLYNDYRDKVIFLFITSDTFDVTDKFNEKNGFNFTVHNAINTVPRNLETSSIPRTFIINKKGEIVIDESGAVDWNSKTVRQQLDQLLAE